MSTTVVTGEYQRDQILKLIGGRTKFPFTVKITEGRQRSVEQNKLQRMWLQEAQEQLQEYTVEEYRAFCKLHFGVPILRNGSAHFKSEYDRVFKDLDYEVKLTLMAVPFDFGVTRLMNVKQKSEYLDAMYQHFSSCGVQLTEPAH